MDCFLAYWIVILPNINIACLLGSAFWFVLGAAIIMGLTEAKRSSRLFISIFILIELILIAGATLIPTRKDLKQMFGSNYESVISCNVISFKNR